MLLKRTPPKTEQDLINRCKEIAGLSFSQLASRLELELPKTAVKRKGWLGQAIELALGTDANNLSKPDFLDLGVELKTLPLSKNHKPRESTYVTHIPLLHIHKQCWENSQCYQKLQRVLWVPVEGEPDIPYPQRRIGLGFLWSPSEKQYTQLKQDWEYLTNMICLGRLEEINAQHGTFLQIRPKGANSKSLCDAYDNEGIKTKTLPRGFYLRPCFTASIININSS